MKLRSDDFHQFFKTITQDSASKRGKTFVGVTMTKVISKLL